MSGFTVDEADLRVVLVVVECRNFNTSEGRASRSGVQLVGLSIIGTVSITNQFMTTTYSGSLTLLLLG